MQYCIHRGGVTLHPPMYYITHRSLPRGVKHSSNLLGSSACSWPALLPHPKKTTQGRTRRVNGRAAGAGERRHRTIGLLLVNRVSGPRSGLPERVLGQDLAGKLAHTEQDPVPNGWLLRPCHFGIGFWSVCVKLLAKTGPKTGPGNAALGSEALLSNLKCPAL